MKQNIISGIKKIAIIGVGFMGGSLARDLKVTLPRVSLWGFARSPSSFARLRRLKLLDSVERDLGALVHNSDIVVMALPIYSTIEYFTKIAPYLKKGTIVMDLGSSKELIEKAADKYLPKYVSYVGCHPLCGSEKGGAVNSVKSLYRGAVCVITSTSKDRATKVIAKLWHAIGAKVVHIPSSLHDKFLSVFSHLPHLISFSLTQIAPLHNQQLIPVSFKDLTRVSGSPPDVWADIFLSNKKNILRDSSRFIANMQLLQRYLKANNRGKIIKSIEKINSKHNKLAFHAL